MGELGAFLKIHRVGFEKRDPDRRVHDYKQYFALQPEEELQRQGARCMDCGIPFCHEGCPLGNLIPDWNDLVYRGKWREAIDQLHATNNFPEFTGRICPAPCESACVLAINDDPVTIEQIELAIAERAFDGGLDRARPHRSRRTGKTVAVIGSGPAGLAVADELNRCGHTVTVFERDEGPGGMMRFGVPDAKLEKPIIDRRVAILEQEGIEFVYDTEVGRTVTSQEIKDRHDALVVAIGSRVQRDLDAPGRELRGIHLGDGLPVPAQPVGRCAGGAAVAGPGARDRDQRRGQEGDRGRRRRHRDGLHLELPPRGRAERGPARRLRRRCPTAGATPATRGRCRPSARTTTYALDEGGKRRWGTEVTGFGGMDGRVSHVYARKVTGTSSRDLTPVPGSEFVLEADLVLIAIGFEQPEHEPARSSSSISSSTTAATSAPSMTYRTSTTGRVCLRRRPDRPVADRHRDRRGAQVRPRRQQGPRRQPDGRRPRDAGDRRLERRGRPHAAPRGRGGRHRPAGRGVLHAARARRAADWPFGGL